MHSWRVREKVLNIIEATTGGRVIFGSCKVGGVRRDINADTIKPFEGPGPKSRRTCKASPGFFS